jgi:hypothetical protein
MLLRNGKIYKSNNNIKLRNGKTLLCNKVKKNNINKNPLFTNKNHSKMRNMLIILLDKANKGKGNDKIVLTWHVYNYIKQEILEKIIKYNVAIPENKKLYYEKLFDTIKNKHFQLIHELKQKKNVVNINCVEKDNSKLYVFNTNNKIIEDLENLLEDCFNMVNTIEVTKM